MIEELAKKVFARVDYDFDELCEIIKEYINEYKEYQEDEEVDIDDLVNYINNV